MCEDYGYAWIVLDYTRDPNVTVVTSLAHLNSSNLDAVTVYQIRKDLTVDVMTIGQKVPSSTVRALAWAHIKLFRQGVPV